MGDVKVAVAMKKRYKEIKGMGEVEHLKRGC